MDTTISNMNLKLEHSEMIYRAFDFKIFHKMKITLRDARSEHLWSKINGIWK